MSGGMDEALLDAFEKKVNEELHDAKTPYFMHIENVYAHRRP